MSDTPELTPFTCPSCNAPLEYDGVSPTIRCPFCNTTVAVPEELRKEKEQPETRPAPLVQIEVIEAPAWRPSAPTAEEREELQTSKWITTLSILGLVIFVLSIVGFVMLQPGGPFVPYLVAVTPTILLPGNEQESDTVVSAVYNVTDEMHILARMDPLTGRSLWTSDDMPGSSTPQAITAQGNMIYAGFETTLVALKAEDGSLAWQAELPDRLNYSNSSLVVVDHAVIALTLDQSITAFDTDTGQQIWNRTLEGYDRTIRVVCGRLLVVDYLPGEYTYALYFLNPLDGSESLVLTPRCPAMKVAEYGSTDTISPDDGIFYDTENRTLTLVYGDYLGCVQQYTLPEGTLNWELQDPEGFYAAPNNLASLMTDQHLFMGYGQKLAVVDIRNRSITSLLSEEDYYFVPLALLDNTLIVRAFRHRGSGSYALWGISSDTGEHLWSYDIEASGPVDPPDEMSGLIDDSDFAWSWFLGSEGLEVLRFRAEPPQVLLEVLNPVDGSSLNQTTIALKEVDSDFYSIPERIGCIEQTCLFLIDSKIAAIDLAENQVTFSKP